MNVVEKYIKQVLRDKYQLRVGLISSGPHLGRYTIVRVTPSVHVPGSFINQLCDREIAQDLNCDYRWYQKHAVNGMVKDLDYFISKDYVGNENIYFSTHKRCMIAMFSLYRGLERWHPPYEPRSTHRELAGSY